MIYNNHVRNMMGGTTKIKTVEGVPPLTLSKSKGKNLKDYKIYGNSYQRLPQEYQEVEYIESTGTQYIDTEVTGTTTSGLTTYLDAQGTSKALSSNVLFSANGGANAGQWFGFGNTWSSGTGAISDVSYDTRIQVNVTFGTKVEYTLNGVTYSRNGSIGSGTSKIFHGNAGGGNIFYCNAKLYSCKIWNNNILVRDLIPCYRKSDNVIGMYDLVNGVFYTNAGTGTFLKGENVVPTPEKPIEIESVGDPILPGEYQEVEYISNSIAANNIFAYTTSSNTTKLEIYAKIKQTVATTEQCLVSSSTVSLEFGISSTANRLIQWTTKDGSNAVVSTIPLLNKDTEVYGQWTTNSRTLTIDNGQTSTTSSSLNIKNLGIYLLSYSAGTTSTTNYPFKSNLYWLKIYIKWLKK